MPSDYDKIKNDNIRRRGEEFDDIGVFISEQLYSDRSHFIYELLQNAEDALQRKHKYHTRNENRVVKFKLFKDRLEFRHFGLPFDENDVRGITELLKGTKTKDRTQIGKFGIGFKSVYAFTATPEIHSGDENFIIERYIRPKALDSSGDILSDETIFIFPFNHHTLSCQEAFELISNKLRNLGSRVLLFLNNIEGIEWFIEETQEEGHYIKNTEGIKNEKSVTLVSKNNNQDEYENWLVFGRSILDIDKSKIAHVEVGFMLETDGNNQTVEIVKIQQSPLIVYFPTEKETCFGFLIQGPYITTPSRDNIPKDEKWNNLLISETAILITEIFQSLKDMGLLTVNLLDAMPIRMEAFPKDEIFWPIVEAVRNSLLNEELLPTYDGTFISAKRAKLARYPELIKLLNPNQLRDLFKTNEEIKWLSDKISQGRTPDLRNYIMDELDVKEISPSDFAGEITRSFLENQKDNWFIEFYEYLSGQERLWRSPRSSGQSAGILREKPILRLEDNSHVPPFRSDGTEMAYFPPHRETDLPIIKRDIVQTEKVVEFLKRLGLKEPDLFDEIVKKVIPKYKNNDYLSITVDEHKIDIKKIFHAMESDSEAGRRKVRKSIERTPFILSIDKNGNLSYRKPEEVYIDTMELRLYFSDADEVWFVHKVYSEWPSSQEVLADFGVADIPRRISFSSEVPEEIKEHSTGPESVHNYNLDGLKKFLTNLEGVFDFESRRKRSLVLWEYLCRHFADDPYFFNARYDWVYYHDKSKYFDSCMLTDLREIAWLPGKYGRCHMPKELRIDDLHESFVCDVKFANELGMKKEIEVQFAEEYNLPNEYIDLILHDPKTRQYLEERTKKLKTIEKNSESTKSEIDVFSEFEKPFNRPGKNQLEDEIEQSHQPVRNPERRRGKEAERHIEMITNEPDPKERRRITEHAILAGPDDQVRQSLEEWYGGKCQICGGTFPERNGRPFFITKYIVPRKFAQQVDTYANAVCLCAEHLQDGGTEQ